MAGFVVTFPTALRDVVTELYVHGDWVDVSGDVRGGNYGITVANGRPNEAGDPQPSFCGFTLSNPDGHYSPDWPEGDYYGSLDRNAPTRTTINLIRDSCGRTVINGWGVSDTGHTYTNSGTGGVVAAGDHNVAAGVATMSIPATNATRTATITGFTARDVDVAVTVAVPFTNVTGFDVSPLSIKLRDFGGTDSVFASIFIYATEEIALRILDGTTNTEIGEETVIDGLTHTSAQALRMRFQAEGSTFRAKVWAAGGPEPYGWHLTGHSDGHPAAGAIQIMGWVLAGNTNTLPIVFSYDNITVRSLLHGGDVSSWPADWDISGNDVVAAVESYGITRRLGQGTSPVQSTLYRGISNLSSLLAYWPCEDGPDSSVLASTSGGPPITVSVGPTTFSAYSEFDCSAPIPTVGESSLWTGYVPTHADPTQLQLRFLLSIPDAGIADSVLCDIQTANGYNWSVWYQNVNNGQINRNLYRGNTELHTSPYTQFLLNGRDVMISIEIQQVGSNAEMRVATLEPGESVGAVSGTSTINNVPVNKAIRVLFGLNSNIGGVSIGHVYLTNTITSLFDLGSELAAYRGETALTRLQRLCDQNSVSLSYTENPFISTELMGPQRVQTLFQLLKECGDVDRGTLHDSVGELGLTYRSRASIYNQHDIFTLDYATGQIGEPFKPVRDDQATRNDITVSRINGSFARAELRTGPLSVQDPADGGVGRYDTQLTVNTHTDSQLDNIAGFELRKGTISKTRYPSVTINLHNHNVVADTTLSANALGLGVDDRFTVINPPVGQTADDIILIARGWTTYLTNFIHSITINAAPADPYEVLKFDGGATHASKWDTGGSELASGVTSTATSFSVTTTTGPIWTTSAGHMPIAILVGGEEVSVTAISGTGSPQTFTVTRSVNGIVKAHTAGTSLSLARRPVFGL